MKIELPTIVATQFTVQTLDALFDRPIFQPADFVARSGISKRTSLRILGALEESGVLTAIREQRGQKGAVLAFSKLIELTEVKRVV
jgi:hypothetical protein